jgi:lipid II:glycine glycyltransferase (peptidoglycan interpeptide bridge formation enzyme)
MILSTRYGLTLGDIFFDEPLPESHIDLCRQHYAANPIGTSHLFPHSTVVIDLRRDPEALLRSMTKTARYEIRRAEQDAFIYARQGIEAIDPFLAFFNQFAKDKGTKPASAHWLSVFAQKAALVLTSVCERGGSQLVWHAYMRSGAHVRLLYSASAYIYARDTVSRTFIGRANRYCHWRDCLMFREARVTTCDLGGVCEPCDDRVLMGIREFKTSLGGAVVRRFDCTEALSAKGRAAERVLNLAFRLRGVLR